MPCDKKYGSCAYVQMIKNLLMDRSGPTPSMPCYVMAAMTIIKRSEQVKFDFLDMEKLTNAEVSRTKVKRSQANVPIPSDDTCLY